MALKSELRHLLVIAQQLEPYIRSITALMERVQPEVGVLVVEMVVQLVDVVVLVVVQVAVLLVQLVMQVGGQEHEVVEEPVSMARAPEDERIAAILERIQAIKPEYKQRVEALQRGEASNGVRKGAPHAPAPAPPPPEEHRLHRTPSKEVRPNINGFISYCLFVP